MRLAIRVICLVVGFVATIGTVDYCYAGQKRRFTVSDDISLCHFGAPYTSGLGLEPITFSPDGQYFLVYTECGLLNRNRPESNIRVYGTQEIRHFLLEESAAPPSPVWAVSKSTYKDGPIITHIRWLADSTGFAFLANSNLGINQLFLAELKTQNIYPLTQEDEDVTGFDIRDAKHLVYTILSPTINAKAVAENQGAYIVGTGRSLRDLLFPDAPQIIRTHELSEIWAVLDGKRFRVEDKASGRPIPMYGEGEHALALSPDGQALVTALAVAAVPHEWEALYQPPFASYPYRLKTGPQDTAAFDGHLYASEYAVIDLTNGAVKFLTHAPTGNSAGWWGGWTRADWSPDSQSVVLPNTFVAQDSQVQHELPRPCVAVADFSTGSLTCVERLKGQTKDGYESGWHLIEKVEFVQRDRMRLVVSYRGFDGSQGGATVYEESSNGVWTPCCAGIDEPGRTLSPIHISIDQSLNSPPVLVARDYTAKRTRIIWDPNPYLGKVELGQVSVFKWKDKAGRDWVGGLYKPPDYSPNTRYPLVIQTHGFAQHEFRPGGQFPTAFAAQELAAYDILVLQVSDCSIDISPEEGPCQVDGYETAVNQLAAEGLIDPDRIGIVGFSRSCYYVLEALTRSTVHFKAASITDGINVGYLQYIASADSREDALAPAYEVMVGARPFGRDLQRWLEFSPTFNMDKVTAPLQVVALGRSKLLTMWEPYATLRFLRKPVDLVVLAEGTHVLTNPLQRKLSQNGTVDWFRFWLKGEEDRDPAKVEQYVRWRKLRDLGITKQGAVSDRSP